MGWLRAHLDDYPGALAACQRALELHRSFDHFPARAATYDSLGHIIGDIAAAREAWQLARDILIELDHPDADVVLAKLASLG